MAFREREREGDGDGERATSLLCYPAFWLQECKQEAQLMLTTGSTHLAVSRGQQHGTILGPLRLFAKHVIGTYR